MKREQRAPMMVVAFGVVGADVWLLAGWAVAVLVVLGLMIFDEYWCDTMNARHERDARRPTTSRHG